MARKRAVVTLFGQMGVGVDTPWRTQRIEAAFQDSDLLWLENPPYAKSPPETLQAVQELSRREAVDPSYSILADLGTRDSARLDKVLTDEGLTPAALAGRGPPAVRQYLSVVADRRCGVDVASLPESWFRARAEESGKPICTEWADLLDVVRWGLRTPRPLQLDLVRLALDEIDRATGHPRRLAAWSIGDVRSLESWSRDIARRYPALYRRLSVQRNAALAARIANAAGERRHQFICVGALHLAGEGSLPAQLRKAGFRAAG
jgi:uncharacterized protein YbaP (TraB family)